MVEDQTEKTGQLRETTRALIATVNTDCARLIFQELSTGLAFVKLALDFQKRGQSKAALGQRDAAIKAYQTILKFLPKTAPTPSQKERIKTDLAKLKSKLDALATDFT